MRGHYRMLFTLSLFMFALGGCAPRAERRQAALDAQQKVVDDLTFICAQEHRDMVLSDLRRSFPDDGDQKTIEAAFVGGEAQDGERSLSRRKGELRTYLKLLERETGKDRCRDQCREQLEQDLDWCERLPFEDKSGCINRALGRHVICMTRCNLVRNPANAAGTR